MSAWLDRVSPLLPMGSPGCEISGTRQEGDQRAERRRLRLPMCLLIAGALALALFGGCGGDMQAQELSRSIDTIVSSAGEGQLLARGVTEDGTKTTFVRVRAQELGDTVDHESEKLQDATAGPDVAPAKRRAVRIADAVSSALGSLQVDPDGDATAEAANLALKRLSSRAQRLQETL